MYLEKAYLNVDHLVTKWTSQKDFVEENASQPRILFIDDEPNLVFDVVQSLKKSINADISFVTNFDDAEKVLQTHKDYDLIILDAMIPKKNEY
jgi:CheY-like chemotaxis protein